MGWFGLLSLSLMMYTQHTAARTHAIPTADAAMPAGAEQVDKLKADYDAKMAEMVRAPHRPFIVQWGKNRLCVLERHYAGTA